MVVAAAATAALTTTTAIVCLLFQRNKPNLTVSVNLFGLANKVSRSLQPEKARRRPQLRPEISSSLLKGEEE